ncbi:MAG: ATP-binding protein [Treponema sp.]|jgi:predicted AAA+ superfamily ATPase|nr:ATP-binding protein [Treponema sp.]
MVQRGNYIEKLKKLRDTELIKVVTGVRRCGKSTVLQLFSEYLLETGLAPEQIISINFEDIRFEELLDYRKLHAYVSERLVDGKMTYVFLDEIQNVPDFQRAVDSLFIKKNVDVYVTGSNARLLSGELATLLSGRYIEIPLLPLSFSEYYEMKGGDKREAFTGYFRNGGFPYAAAIADEEIRNEYLRGVYNTVLLKDIVGRKHIANVELLERVIRFLFDNIGNLVSAKKIADSLTSSGIKTSPITVDSYIEALMDAYILYRAGRYDVKGKQHLQSLEKYYLVDAGLRRMLLGDSNRDIGYILENVVYLELLRRGSEVSVGKVDEQEVDFIAQAGGEKTYYQVAASVLDAATLEREIAPLEKIKDNYPKCILTLDDILRDVNGIRQMNIIDFLLERGATEAHRG